MNADTIANAKAVVAYLRENGDFSRSWTDGRNGDRSTATPLYIARRLEIAEKFERWATAIESLIPAAPEQPPEKDGSDG